MTSDPRLGLPSASGMDRLHNCPASFIMEKAHGQEEETEDAASGTRIHAVLAGLASESTLSAAEVETAEMCNMQKDSIVQEWLGHPYGTDEDQAFTERRLGLTVLGKVLDVTPESPANFIFTGQADLVCIEGERALVIDYKTGRGDTPIAQDNPQLAALAVLVALRHQVQRVRVAVVQPWAGPPTVADYDSNALALAKSWLLATLEAARDATQADLRPGSHCKWCKAKHVCPALKQQALQEIERIQPMSIAGLPPKEQASAIWARAMELTPQQHAAAYRGLEMVERYAHAIKATFKQRVEAGEIPGYGLKEKKGRRSVSDVGLIFERCSRQGVSAADFTARCSIGLGEVKEALRHATGLKGKALDALHEACLVEAVETSKPSFEVVQLALEGGGE